MSGPSLGSARHVLASPDTLATRPARVARAFVVSSVPADDSIAAADSTLACVPVSTAPDGTALRGRPPPLTSSVGVSGRRCLKEADDGCCWNCLKELDNDVSGRRALNDPTDPED